MGGRRRQSQWSGCGSEAGRQSVQGLQPPGWHCHGKGQGARRRARWWRWPSRCRRRPCSASARGRRAEAREQFSKATDDGAAESGLSSDRTREGKWHGRGMAWHGMGLRGSINGRPDAFKGSYAMAALTNSAPFLFGSGDEIIQTQWVERKPSSWTRARG